MLFAAISAFVIWALPLLGISLGVSGFLISDALHRAGRNFNVRGLVLVAGGVFMIFFAVFYAILGLGLDLQTTETAQAQGAGYLEMAKAFGLMSATGLVVMTLLGVWAIIRAHRELRRTNLD
ncbi:MAG: hypothetical protein ACKOWJ_06320 [Micrococcales bacterium]